MPLNSEHSHELAALRLQELLRQRTDVNESIGVLQVWHHCGQDSARHDLAVAQDAAAEGVSAAAHVIAVVDADADSSADPDAPWE